MHPSQTVDLLSREQTRGKRLCHSTTRKMRYKKEANFITSFELKIGFETAEKLAL